MHVINACNKSSYSVKPVFFFTAKVTFLIHSALNISDICFISQLHVFIFKLEYLMLFSILLV